MNVTQEIYVTSTTIAHVRARLDDELKDAISFVRALTGSCQVEPPGFGLLGGIIMGGSYDAMCGRAEAVLGEAEGVVDGWVSTLGVAQRNWREAEKHSMVTYR